MMTRTAQAVLSHLVLLSLLVLAVPARAQTITGTITGVVTDATGAVVAGATVTIREVKTNLTMTTTTDTSGLYRVTNLPRGIYEIKVEQKGFKTAAVDNVELTVNEVKRVDVTLEVGEISEIVTVTGEVPLINTEEGRLSGLVDKRRIVDLPLVTRDFTQLALLQPGVVAGGIGSNTGGFSIGGARSRGTNFLVDGIENNDPVVAGFAQIVVPLDSVEEFRLIRNTFGAEFGRLSGGVLSVATKSGSNEIHGTVWEFHRDRSLRARNFFEREKPPFVRNQFGFDLGGPILKDKFFAYGSYEATTLRSSTSQRARFFTAEAIRAATGPVARDLLQRFPRPVATENPRFVTVGNEQIPVSAETVITRPDSSDFHSFVVRLDHQGFGGRNRISGRYIFNQTNNLAPLASNSLLTEFFGLDTSFRSQNVGLTNTTLIRPNVINELKLGLTRDAFDWRPRNPQVPTITI
ncbi:MAG TPA: carboxypeptidase regulatory-like domain-containing protein, partial [Blastocatellia bacterium]|nr:carboxypeptidase regulatory-like domain-containing protein [Blastocatellia bacterium]